MEILFEVSQKEIWTQTESRPPGKLLARNIRCNLPVRKTFLILKNKLSNYYSYKTWRVHPIASRVHNYIDANISCASSEVKFTDHQNRFLSSYSCE